MATKVACIVSDDDQEEVESSSGVEGDESDVSQGSNQSVNDSNNDASDGETDKSKANPGWADAMKKILSTSKPKKKKSIVLSKAKKLNEVKSKPKEIPVPFEIETKDGEIKKESLKVEDDTDEDKTSNEHKKQKRKDTLGVRVKPSVLDRERERRLQKIATNGVVQLFNAVSQQQKEIENKLKEAGPLERKREKALKNIDRRAFLDVLMGGTNNIEEVDDTKEIKDEEDEDNKSSKKKKDNKVWSVLKDEYVMGAKLKDWNKHDTDENDSSAPEEMDSD